MKEYCPECKKEVEMRERLEDLDENTGVFVKAFVCEICGESLTDVHEYERAQSERMKMNVLKFERKIVKIGNSSSVRIPQEILAAAHMHVEKPVTLYVNKKHQIIVESKN